MSADEFLTVTQVAARLQVKERVISRLVQAGQIPHLKVGKAVRIRWRDVEAWADTSAGLTTLNRNPVTFRDPSSASSGIESLPMDTTPSALPFSRGARRHKIAPEVRQQNR